MKGHIFDLLEKFIREQVGEDALYEIIDACSFDTSAAFVRSAVYPDDNLYEMVGRAVDRLGIEPEVAHAAFGRWIIPELGNLMPGVFDRYDGPCAFLAGLDEMHQVSLKKIYPDAEPPRFAYQSINEEEGVIRYQSPRGLHHFMAGCLEGVADVYGVRFAIEWEPPASGTGCDYRVRVVR
jgi:hypothetical protein